MSPVTHFAQHPSTLAHDLAIRAVRHGGRTAVEFTPGDGTWSALSYAELAGRAAVTADLFRSLRGRAGHPRFVLIMLPNSIEYVVSVYGCAFAGAVAVPFYPPTVLTSRTAKAFGDRLRQICRDCQPSAIVLPADVADYVGSIVEGPQLVTVPDLPQGSGDIHRIDARPGDLALLQYTSGSTM
jgi:acyl-CoA synthetase (AMP-forming)/AMP-acid ligase II